MNTVYLGGHDGMIMKMARVGGALNVISSVGRKSRGGLA